MPGHGFKVPEHMLPYRSQLSDAEKKLFVRSWFCITRRSVIAWITFLISIPFVYVVLARHLLWQLFHSHYLDPFSALWCGVASVIIASVFAFLTTRHKISVLIREHLTKR